MISRGSSSRVGVFFTIFVIVVFEVTEQQPPPTNVLPAGTPPSGEMTLYATEIKGGELGIKMRYNPKYDTRLVVVIVYATETATVTDFFQKQLTADLFKKVSDCGVVYWNFMPCGTSKLNNGALSSPNGPDQCKFDKIHACVATLYKKDEQKVGHFVTCFFVNNKDLNKCVTESAMVQADIDNCVSTDGAKDCDAFYNLIHGVESQQLVGTSTTGIASSEGTTDFKKVLCDNLAKAKMQCDVCTPPLAPSTPAP